MRDGALYGAMFGAGLATALLAGAMLGELGLSPGEIGRSAPPPAVIRTEPPGSSTPAERPAAAIVAPTLAPAERPVTEATGGVAITPAPQAETSAGATSPPPLERAERPVTEATGGVAITPAPQAKRSAAATSPPPLERAERPVTEAPAAAAIAPASRDGAATPAVPPAASPVPRAPATRLIDDPPARAARSSRASLRDRARPRLPQAYAALPLAHSPFAPASIDRRFPAPFALPSLANRLSLTPAPLSSLAPLDRQPARMPPAAGSTPLLPDRTLSPIAAGDPARTLPAERQVRAAAAGAVAKLMHPEAPAAARPDRAAAPPLVSDKAIVAAVETKAAHFAAVDTREPAPAPSRLDQGARVPEGARAPGAAGKPAPPRRRVAIAEPDHAPEPAGRRARASRLQRERAASGTVRVGRGPDVSVIYGTEPYREFAPGPVLIRIHRSRAGSRNGPVRTSRIPLY